MDKYTDENQFLNEMCNTLFACDFLAASAFFHLPCVVVYNQHKHVFNNETELQLWLSAYCKRLHVESRDQITFSVRKQVSMSPTVTFTQMGLDGLKLLQDKRGLDVTLTLSNDVDETLKIIVVVLDDK